MATKNTEKEDPHRQISPVVVGEAAEIFGWLEDLFHLSPRDTQPGKPKTEPDAMPERVVLRAVYGRGGVNLGPEIKAETWKPMVSPLPTREKLVELANKFYGLAQKDCSALGNMQRYGLFAYSNLKGHAAYERHLFVMTPGHKEYAEKEAPASDDEDTHRDRLLSQSLAHARWQQEQFTEAMSGVLKLQQEMIRQQADTIARQDAERRAWILASEEALSKKQEREIAADWAKFKHNMIGDMWSSIKGLLPAVAIYASKGKVGVAEGLKNFIDSLSKEATIALFGEWDDGSLKTPGILDQDQVQFIAGIIKGSIEPTRMGEFVTNLRQEQMMAIQERNVLTPDQIQSLMILSKAAQEAASRN